MWIQIGFHKLKETAEKVAKNSNIHFNSGNFGKNNIKHNPNSIH